MAILLVVLFGRLDGHGRWVPELSNAAHGPVFALVTLIISALIRRSSLQHISVPAEYSLTIVIAILLGALVELLQSLTGRDATLDDLWRDTLGALTAGGALLLFDGRVRASSARRAGKALGLTMAVVAGTLMLTPFVVTGSAYWLRHHGFPVLADFSSPLGLYFLGAEPVTRMERRTLPVSLQSGEHRDIGLNVQLNDQDDWGFVLREPVSDWRGYSRLSIDLANPTDAPLRLRLRIVDLTHERHRRLGFRETFEVAPRSRVIESVALGEVATAAGDAKTDISQVESIVLGRGKTNAASEFYVMRMWLE